MRRLYDSTDPNDIPADAQMVGGYIDGTFAWSEAGWARFPNAAKVRIAVSWTTKDGHVLDVETGDATPSEAVGWVQGRRAAGADPSVYCSESEWTAVRTAFATAGEPEPHYWIAHYDNDPSIPLGAIAKQYADDTLTGGHYDLSSVADFWPGVDDMTEDQVKDIIRVMLGSDEGVALVKSATTAPAGYGPALEDTELKPIKEQLAGKALAAHSHSGTVTVS